jgi:hypothetical protein
MLPAEVLSPMKPVRILLIVIVVLYAVKLIVPVPAVNEVILKPGVVDVESVKPEPPEME